MCFALHPLNIKIKAALNWQCDDLGYFICVHRFDRFFERPIPNFGRFQYEENFLCFNNFSVPAIYRLNPWNNIRAGSQLRIHHSFTNPYGLFLTFNRNQNDKNLLRLFLHKGCDHWKTILLPYKCPPLGLLGAISGPTTYVNA